MSMFSGGEIGCDGTLPGVATTATTRSSRSCPDRSGPARPDHPAVQHAPTYPGPSSELPTGHRIDSLRRHLHGHRRRGGVLRRGGRPAAGLRGDGGGDDDVRRVRALVREVQRQLQGVHRGRQRVVLTCQQTEFDQLLAVRDGLPARPRSPGSRCGPGRTRRWPSAGRAGGRSGSRRAVRALEDLLLQGLVDTAGPGQPAVLLQLVFAVAQVTDPQDDDLGVSPRQPAPVEQHR